MASLRVLRARPAARHLLRQLQGPAAQPLSSLAGSSVPAATPSSAPAPGGPLSSVHCVPSPLRSWAAASPSPLRFFPATCASVPSPATSAQCQPICHSSSSPKDSTPDSDDDFKPQYRKPEEATPIHKLIDEEVKGAPVMVYMKGSPSMPMCGFSGAVVQLLKAYGVDFKSRNVLEDAELRQGIKTYSQWPTIPQVFVNGEFVGGCDILYKMHEDGELEKVFAPVVSKSSS